MFPTVKFIFYPLAHALAIVVFFASMRAGLRGEPRRLRHSLVLTGIYVFCNGVMAKVFHVVLRDDPVESWTDFLNPLFYFPPGFWGWLMAFLPLAVVYPFVFKTDVIRHFRALALTLPFVIALQKVACFVSGCCAGDRTDVPWAVVFPTGSGAPIEHVPVHPTQIYDMLLALSWYGVLRIIDRKEALRPYLFFFFLMLYAVSRFLTELLRPEFDDGFTNSQKLEALVLATVLLGLAFGRKLWLRIAGAGARDA
jgi:phosphatidylglycerol:prolipoprotein diacylglycerol transferase